MILGVDPGASVGWALLTLEGRFQGAGVLEGLEPRAVVLRLITIASGHRRVHVAVETLEEVDHRPGFGPRMASDLCRTERLGGRIVQAFEDRGAVVSTPSAKAVRVHFFGQGAVDNAAMTALCQQRIAGWPKRSNDHVRAAGAVALFAAQH